MKNDRIQRDSPELVVAQYHSTRWEILLCMFMEFAIWVWTLDRMLNAPDAVQLCILGIAYVWGSAKVAWVMHRLGGFNKQLEQWFLEEWGWEHFKPVGPMAILAIGVSLPQLWYFNQGASTLFGQGRISFVGCAVALFLFGALMVFIGPKLFRKE